MKLHFPTVELDISQPCIMGILNLTPDSFSDGGLFLDKEKALTLSILVVNQHGQVQVKFQLMKNLKELFH